MDQFSSLSAECSEDDDYGPVGNAVGAGTSSVRRGRAIKAHAAEELEKLQDYRYNIEVKRQLEEEMAKLHACWSQEQSYSSSERREEYEGVSSSGQDQDEQSLQLWQEHETRWQAFEMNPPVEITLTCIPWPPSSQGILARMVSVEGRRDESAEDEEESLNDCWKRSYRKASLRWHPDKFIHRYAARLKAGEEKAIMDRVQLISQSVNGECTENMRAARSG